MDVGKLILIACLSLMCLTVSAMAVALTASLIREWRDRRKAQALWDQFAVPKAAEPRRWHDATWARTYDAAGNVIGGE